MTENEMQRIAWNATEKLCGEMGLESALDNFFCIMREALPLKEIILGRQDAAGQKIFVLSRTTIGGTERLNQEFLYSEEQIELIHEQKFFEPENVRNMLVDSPEHFIAKLTDFEHESSLPFYATRNFYQGKMSGGCRFVFKKNVAVTDAMLRLLDMVSPPLRVFINAWFQYDEIEALKNKLVRENRAIRQKLTGMDTVRLVGAHGGLKNVIARLQQVAPLNVSTLILGETGTGKELVAHALHEMSPRKNKPFVTINCGAIPLSLIDSQLFGHVRGAFTGAMQDHQGVFEQAEGGTLFLDEIGELPLEAQARLLRVLEQRQILRVGGKTSLSVDFRLVTATNRNLENMVSEGAFREDLYYRLKVVTITVPPLRERKQDILPLLQHFMEKAALQFGMVEPQVPDGEMQKLLRHDWLGNVREFQNVVQEAMAFSSSGRLVFWPADMPVSDEAFLAEKSKGVMACSYEQVVKDYLSRALRQTRGKIRGPGGLAELADLNYSTLRAKLKKYHISYGRKQN